MRMIVLGIGVHDVNRPTCDVLFKVLSCKCSHAQHADALMLVQQRRSAGGGVRQARCIL